MGETLEGLKKDIAMMMTAFDLPTMSDADFSAAGSSMSESLSNRSITRDSTDRIPAESKSVKHD